MSFGTRDETAPLVGLDGTPDPITVPAGGDVEVVPAMTGPTARVAVMLVNLSDDFAGDPIWLDFGQGPTLPLWAHGQFAEYVTGPIRVHNPGADDVDVTYQGFAAGEEEA